MQPASSLPELCLPQIGNPVVLEGLFEEYHEQFLSCFHKLLGTDEICQVLDLTRTKDGEKVHIYLQFSNSKSRIYCIEFFYGGSLVWPNLSNHIKVTQEKNGPTYCHERRLWINDCSKHIATIDKHLQLSGYGSSENLPLEAVKSLKSSWGDVCRAFFDDLSTYITKKHFGLNTQDAFKGFAKLCHEYAIPIAGVFRANCCRVCTKTLADARRAGEEPWFMAAAWFVICVLLQHDIMPEMKDSMNLFLKTHPVLRLGYHHKKHYLELPMLTGQKQSLPSDVTWDNVHKRMATWAFLRNMTIERESDSSSFVVKELGVEPATVKTFKVSESLQDRQLEVELQQCS